jgi:hypothetical protein
MRGNLAVAGFSTTFEVACLKDVLYAAYYEIHFFLLKRCVKV